MNSNRSRRIALGLGIAAGASLAATFVSMGTAAADTDTPPDPFSDLGLPGGSSLDSFLNSVLPTFATQLDPYVDNLVAAGDPNAFADLYGPSAAILDTLYPSISSVLDPAVDAINPADADPFADLLGAANGAALDTFVDHIPFGTTTLGGFLDPFADAILGMPF